MEIWEVLLIGIALSMDAVAVGMTNGMAEPKMRVGKMLCVAGAYAVFQFLMPVIGYYCGYAFSSLVEKIAPWLSFALLAFIGGKMIFDFIRETVTARKKGASGTTDASSSDKSGTDASDENSSDMSEREAMDGRRGRGKEETIIPKRKKSLGMGKLLLQALATSMDALAVGVTMLAEETAEGLPMHITLCALVIGGITFSLSLTAVLLGKKVGNRFSDKAGLLGGLILLAIGIKILIEGLV